MFNSLATFLFGAQATSEPSENCVANPVQQQQSNQANEDSCAAAAGDVIEVTSSTPSVAGNQRGTVQRSSNGSGKRSGAKQRRARQRQQQQQQQKEKEKQSKHAPSITKLLTPNGESPLEEDFNEDEWYIVEKEDGEEDSLPRSDSEEEELSVVESKPATATTGTSPVPTGPSFRRRQLHLQTHSLYSGPRPHQHRNRLSRALNIRVPLTMSAMSPPRIVPVCDATNNGNGNGNSSGNGGDDSDNSLTQSLYAPPSALSPCNSESSDGSTGHGSVVLMEESWYVTPPPCFTSIGPINMEASPFENLLIEHPSMSVYHSIRSSQAGTESFVNLDLGAAESTAQPEPEETLSPEQQAQLERQNRATSARFDRHHAAEQKKIELARRSLMNKVQDEHHRFVKTALTRSNKVMAQQSKGHQRRRSDMQHFKQISGANNNRKCC